MFETETIREAAGRAADRATDRAPDAVGDRIERACAPVIDEARARRADRAFAERTLPAATADADAPTHVVVVVVDCLRADALDAEVAPYLASRDAAGASGSASDDESAGDGDGEGAETRGAVAPSTWTFPSVTSLVTGRYPHDHGAMRRTDGDANSVADMTPLPPRLDDGATTLPERLAGAGYATYGSFGMLVPFLALRGRFARHRLAESADADEVLGGHLRWLLDRRDRRTFSYLHLSDLHEPVDPPEAYWRAHGVDPATPGVKGWRHEDVIEVTPTVERYRDRRWRLYRAAVEYVDNRLGAYVRRLRDLADDALVIVAGDHGEAFWERAAFDAEAFADPRPAYCVGHGGAPYEPVARVPLLADGLGAGVADGPASLIDLASTVADETGVALPESDGVSLTRPRPSDRRLLVEGARYGHEKKAVYGDGRKLVVSRGDGVTTGLSVPGDRPTDLPADVRDRLSAALPAWPGDGRPAAGDGTGTGSEARTETKTEASEGVKRRLERLGYA